MLAERQHHVDRSRKPASKTGAAQPDNPTFQRYKISTVHLPSQLEKPETRTFLRSPRPFNRAPSFAVQIHRQEPSFASRRSPNVVFYKSASDIYSRLKRQLNVPTPTAREEWWHHLPFLDQHIEARVTLRAQRPTTSLSSTRLRAPLHFS